MADTPTGAWALPIEHLRTMISESPSWQAWTDAAAPATAKARTFAVDLDPPEKGVDRPYTAAELSGLRPYCVVDTLDVGRGSLRFEKFAEGTFTQGGVLVVGFDDDVDADDQLDPASAKLKFMDHVAGVLTDLLAVAGLDGRLNITSIDVLEGAIRSAVEEVATLGDRFTCYIAVTYGV